MILGVGEGGSLSNELQLELLRLRSTFGFLSRSDDKCAGDCLIWGGNGDNMSPLINSPTSSYEKHHYIFIHIYIAKTI